MVCSSSHARSQPSSPVSSGKGCWPPPPPCRTAAARASPRARADGRHRGHHAPGRPRCWCRPPTRAPPDRRVDPAVHQQRLAQRPGARAHLPLALLVLDGGARREGLGAGVGRVGEPPAAGQGLRTHSPWAPSASSRSVGGPRPPPAGAAPLPRRAGAAPPRTRWSPRRPAPRAARGGCEHRPHPKGPPGEHGTPAAHGPQDAGLPAVDRAAAQHELAVRGRDQRHRPAGGAASGRATEALAL